MDHNTRGFTLVELMITLAVAALLLTLGVPAFFNTIQSNRVAAQANNLASGFAYARSEAVTQGQTVSICARSEGSVTACGNDWQDGWLVFRNAEPPALNPPTAADVIRVGDALPDTVNVTEQADDAISSTLVHFLRLGDIALPAGGTDDFNFSITIRPEDCTSGANHQRTLDLSRVGRSQIRQEECP